MDFVSEINIYIIIDYSYSVCKCMQDYCLAEKSFYT